MLAIMLRMTPVSRKFWVNFSWTVSQGVTLLLR